MTMNGTRHTEEIESEIKQTRSRLDDTLDALQGKLSSRHLLEQAVDYFYESGSAGFLYELGQTIKRNPVPVAMIGIGLAWLMIAGPKRNASVREAGRDAYDLDLDMEASDIYSRRGKVYGETISK